MEAVYLVIPTVDCEGVGAHEGHPMSESFLDRPRLFAGDSKASSVRGKKPLEDAESYIQQQENACLVAYKNYQCAKYHDEVKKEFVRTKLPNMEMTVSARVWPFLFTLQRGGPEARHGHESMAILSGELTRWLKKLDQTQVSPEDQSADRSAILEPRPGSLMPPPPADLSDQPEDMLRMDAPYLRLYHQRQTMSDYISNNEDETKQQILALSSYMEKEYGGEYSEAHALFARGLVSKKHLHKLFGPSQVVVAIEEGQPRAYMCTSLESIHTALELDYWTWVFDGFFRKIESVHTIKWPSTKGDTIEVNALDMYPLRFDQTGLDQRLQARGERFWTLRSRRFVSYQSKNPSFEIRTVRGLVYICSFMGSLKQWGTSPQSSLLVLQSGTRANAASKRLAVVLVTHIQSQSHEVLFSLSLPPSDTYVPSTETILKSLVAQAMRNHSDILPQLHDGFNLEKLKSSHSEGEWLDLLSKTLSKLGNCVIIIESEDLYRLCGGNLAWPFHFISAFRQLTESVGASDGVVKTLVVNFSAPDPQLAGTLDGSPHVHGTVRRAPALPPRLKRTAAARSEKQRRSLQSLRLRG